MRTDSLISLVTALLLIVSCRSERNIDIYGTTDLHGMLLPYDFTEGAATDHSLANLSSLVSEKGNDNIVLLDNGDILQGDPLVYYYNFVDTAETHVVSDILNNLGYDAATVGNHDIETGHRVYDRIREEYNFPLLAANAIDIETGKPYFKPFTVIRKKGLKIIVFGLITPSVPRWLPKSLYEGIRFDNMVETSRKWMPVMKAEKPDLIIGLFHSGLGREDNIEADENSTLAVAINVPGFDVIMAGHDHSLENRTVKNTEGTDVLVLDGGSRASTLMHANVVLSPDSEGKMQKSLKGELIKMNTLPESEPFLAQYKDVTEVIKNYTSEILGRSLRSVSTRESFFGPSAFVDLIHLIQLDITEADISFAAPLSFDEHIDSGNVCVRDVFRLYRFENFLYSMKMSGVEIDRYLEHSYGLWFDTMTDMNDYLLKYRYSDGRMVMVNGLARLRNASYNFDSAMGVRYTVDVTKPEGNRITIIAMSDGAAFYPDSLYTVAINSYRASGGGGHVRAAGIAEEELDSRIISSTVRDLRYYMADWMKNKGEINPEPLGLWTIIPEKWVYDASEREMKLLFAHD